MVFELGISQSPDSQMGDPTHRGRFHDIVGIGPSVKRVFCIRQVRAETKSNSFGGTTSQLNPFLPFCGDRRD